MHLKSNRSKMASLNDDDADTGSGAQSTNASNNNNNNHKNDDDNSSNNNTSTGDPEEIKLKKQTLEQRKQELEKLLGEKSWLLQQIQKQETQIINGNYENVSLNDVLSSLAQQYKQEQAQRGGGGSSNNTVTASESGTSILRRKTVGSTGSSKENQLNNNNNNRQSEISNRSSEYDNYPGSSGVGVGVGSCSLSESRSVGEGVAVAAAQVGPTQLQAKNSLKKRATPTPTPISNLNYIQLQQRQQQQQQQHNQQLLLQHAAEQQMLQYVVQQQQPHVLMPHAHYHQQQQLQLQHQQQQHLLPQQQRQFLSPQQQQHHQQQQQQTDTISLYSVNSANVATLRQQHVAPQQQPIIVQCDKYYLSPTHQSYNDGGFIKSSQNIKRYVSPMASPTTSALQQSQQQSLQHHIMPLQQLQSYVLAQPHAHQHLQSSQQRHLDAISLAPSYVSLDADSAAAAIHNLRWRSQSHIGSSPQSPAHQTDAKSHSSDMLAHPPVTTMSSANTLNFYPHPPPNLKPKPLDEISISSLNSETQKKCSKPKQWLESSLDGPAIRTQTSTETHLLDVVSIGASNNTGSTRLSQKHAHSHAARERAKLSSQSMSSGRHYSLSAQQKPLSGANKLLQDEEGRRYAKQLSQSTSQLHALDSGNSVVSGVVTTSISPAYLLESTPLDIPNFKYLPPKSHGVQPTPPPRPPPAIVSERPLPLSPAAVANTSAALTAPDIRIESPKNMTIVQQATFQPYKEVTKPFEMSDFYKYSTKFRQKDAATTLNSPTS